MSNYKEYVSFDPPQWILDKGVNPDDIILTGHDRYMVEKALEEISSTLEGAHLLEKVASKYPDGKINIMFNKGGYTTAFTPNDFALGSKDREFKYYDADTGELHQWSIQRVIYHELQHHIHDHKSMNMKNEAEAVRETNKFMSKYYDSPPRDEDTTKGYLSKQNNQWKFKENFTPSGYPQNLINPNTLRNQLAGLQQDQFEKMSPETQSLYEVRNFQELFDEQFLVLEGYGCLNEITTEVEGIEKVPVENPMNQPDINLAEPTTFTIKTLG